MADYTVVGTCPIFPLDDLLFSPLEQSMSKGMESTIRILENGPEKTEEPRKQVEDTESGI